MKQLGVILLIIACACGCKRDKDNDNIKHSNLRIVVKDEFTGWPVRNLPITILEMEDSDGGWYVKQNEIFSGKTNNDGEVIVNSPVRKDRRYRFWKKEPKDLDTLSMDWNFFTREHFIRGDTFPNQAEISFRASGAILIYIADTTFARTGADSVEITGPIAPFYYPTVKSKMLYLRPNHTYEFFIALFKKGMLITTSEKIFVTNYFKAIGPDGTQVHQLKLP